MTSDRCVAIALLALLWLALTCPPVPAATSVSINPSLTLVEPGDTFTVFIWKDSLDIEFDGYEAVVTYDPAIIEFLGADEESVMTDPCYNRWWLVTPDSGSIFMSHALLCGGLTTEGPGALSSLEFEAVAEGSTLISVDYFWLTLGGIWIKDIDWHDGIVRVGYQAGIGKSIGDGEPSLSITVWPNPAGVSDVRIRCSSQVAIGSTPLPLEIFDVRGRVVARPELEASGGGWWAYVWDGTGGDGSSIAGGVYFARIAGQKCAASGRIVLLR
jgi:hypothetical protein